jgi:Ca2+-binding RTX toxin-like protein
LRSSQRHRNALELPRILPDLEPTSIQDHRKGHDSGWPGGSSGEAFMAVFSVPNLTGLNNNGVQFGMLSPLGNPSVPAIAPNVGLIVYPSGALLIEGGGMSLTPGFPLSAATGTVSGLSFRAPLQTAHFSISMNADLSLVLRGFVGGEEATVLPIIFAGKDRIYGSILNDLLKGFDGDDTLRGGSGADTLDGGSGSDFANYQGSGTSVAVDLLNNTAAFGDAQGDTLIGIENLYGSSYGDILTGDNGRNIIGGELGNDTLAGNGGDDALAGEGGSDYIEGDDGNDRIAGGDGIDRMLGNAGNDSIDGGADQDEAFGDAGDDSLTGGLGDDYLEGGDGNDILEGGAGADNLTGGLGIDTASYASSAAGVAVVLGGASSGGDAAGDTFSSIEQVIGSAQADSITGDASSNTLWGMAGDDLLTGAGGADVLKGGAGNDRFAYTDVTDSTVAAAGRDTVMDFTTGDKIDLSAIDADGDGLNGNTAFTFGTGAFTAAGQIRVLDFGASRYGVYLETTGNKVEDAIITVYSDHILTAADFVL